MGLFRDDPQTVSAEWLAGERRGNDARAAVDVLESARFGPEYRRAVKARILGHAEPERDVVVRPFTHAIGEKR